MLSNLKLYKSFSGITVRSGTWRFPSLHTTRKYSTVEGSLSDEQRSLFSQRAEQLFHQAESLVSSKKYQEAELPLLSCRQVTTILNNTTLRGKVCGMLGYSYHQREFLPSAETFLKESIELLASNKAESTFVALITSYLAEVYSKTNRLSDATRSSKRALELLSSGKPDDYMVAAMQSNIAGYLVAESKYDEAEGLLKQALSFFDSSLGKHNPVTKRCAINLVKILKASGKEDDINALKLKWEQETVEKAKKLQEAAKQKFEQEKWLEVIEEEWKNRDIKRFDPPGLFLPTGLKNVEQQTFSGLWEKIRL